MKGYYFTGERGEEHVDIPFNLFAYRRKEGMCYISNPNFLESRVLMWKNGKFDDLGDEWIMREFEIEEIYMHGFRMLCEEGNRKKIREAGNVIYNHIYEYLIKHYGLLKVIQDEEDEEDDEDDIEENDWWGKGEKPYGEAWY